MPDKNAGVRAARRTRRADEFLALAAGALLAAAAAVSWIQDERGTKASFRQECDEVAIQYRDRLRSVVDEMSALAPVIAAAGDERLEAKITARLLKSRPELASVAWPPRRPPTAGQRDAAGTGRIVVQRLAPGAASADGGVRLLVPAYDDGNRCADPASCRERFRGFIDARIRLGAVLDQGMNSLLLKNMQAYLFHDPSASADSPLYVRSFPAPLPAGAGVGDASPASPEILAGSGFRVACRPVSVHFAEQRVWTPGLLLGFSLLILGTYLASLRRRARTEQELDESINRFHQLTENIQEVFWITDPAKNSMVYISPAYERIWGRSCASLYATPKDWIDAIHDEDRERVLRAATTKQAAGTYSEEYRIVRPDGETRWIHDKAFPVFEAGGRVDRIVGIAMDITELKTAQLELAANHARLKLLFAGTKTDLLMSEKRYRLLFERSPEAIFIQVLGEFALVNSALVKLLGADSALDLIGKRVIDSIHPDSRPAAENRMARGRNANTPLTEETWLRQDGAALTVEVIGSPFDFHGVRGMQFFIRDVSRRKALETELIRAQKMEAVGRVASGIAHDFNNLTNAIMNYCHFLLRSVETDDPRRKDVEGIQKAGERSAALTQQLMAFSRTKPLPLRPVELNPIVSGMKEMLSRLAGPAIELALTLDAGAGWVKGDPGQIEQLILNLVVNARDAMPSGGRIEIKTSAPASDNAGAPESFTSLTIKDTGTGMGHDVMSHLFEPFFTTKARGKGTGLGLATVHGIVRQSGGMVRVASKPGEGSEFTAYLVRVEPPPAGARAGEPAKLPAPRTPPPSGRTILLVEDDAMIRETTARWLRKCGYVVLEAPDAEEGLRVHQTAKNRVDLVLTDVVLPERQGPELVKELRSVQPDIKAILMSGQAEESEVRRALANSDLIFLRKPLSLDDLALKIREALGR